MRLRAERGSGAEIRVDGTSSGAEETRVDGTNSGAEADNLGTRVVGFRLDRTVAADVMDVCGGGKDRAGMGDGCDSTFPCDRTTTRGQSFGNAILACHTVQMSKSDSLTCLAAAA